MGFVFGFFEIESMCFGSINDRVQRDFLTIGLLQTFLDVAIIVGLQRDVFVLDDFLIRG